MGTAVVFRLLIVTTLWGVLLVGVVLVLMDLLVTFTAFKLTRETFLPFAIILIPIRGHSVAPVAVQHAVIAYALLVLLTCGDMVGIIFTRGNIPGQCQSVREHRLRVLKEAVIFVHHHGPIHVHLLLDRADWQRLIESILVLEVTPMVPVILVMLLVLTHNL